MVRVFSKALLIYKLLKFNFFCQHNRVVKLVFSNIFLPATFCRLQKLIKKMLQLKYMHLVFPGTAKLVNFFKDCCQPKISHFYRCHKSNTFLPNFNFCFHQKLFQVNASDHFIKKVGFIKPIIVPQNWLGYIEVFFPK